MSVLSLSDETDVEVLAVSFLLFAAFIAAAVTPVPAITPAAATAISFIKSFLTVFISFSLRLFFRLKAYTCIAYDLIEQHKHCRQYEYYRKHTDYSAARHKVAY